MWGMINRFFDFFAVRDFTLTIRSAAIVEARGVLPKRICAKFADAVTACGIQQGTICAIRTPDGVSLRFSKDIADAYQQRFRNIWANR